MPVSIVGDVNNMGFNSNVKMVVGVAKSDNDFVLIGSFRYNLGL